MSEAVELIKQAVDHLLDCNLTEENGWTEKDIQILAQISQKEFEINFK